MKTINKVIYSIVSLIAGSIVPGIERIEIDPPDLIIYVDRNKIVLNRFLICRDVDYTPVDLSWSSLRSRIESYIALMNTLPSDVHVYLVKEEVDLSRLIRRLSNEIINLQSDIETTPEESTRIKMKIKLDKLRALYDLILKGRPFIRVGLILVYRIKSSDKKTARDMANYYESLIQSTFTNAFGVRLERATHSEIVSVVLSMLGVIDKPYTQRVEVDGYKIALIQPISMDKPPVLDKTILLGWSREDLHPLEIAVDDLYKHVAIIGPTGRGKTTLLAGLIEQLVSEDLARVIAIDFKGDLKRYMENNVLELLSPRDYAVNILSKPTVIEHADWRLIVAESLSHASNTPSESILEALFSLENKNEDWLLDPRVSVLIPFMDLVGKGDQVEELIHRMSEDNVIIDVEGYGISFQNAYVSICIGLIRHILLKQPRGDQGGVVLAVDDAWRITGLRAISEIIREGRSRRLGVILSTQNPTDIPEGLLENIHHVLVFGSRNGEYIEKVSRVFNLDEETSLVLPRLDVGEAVFVNTATRDTRVIKTYTPRIRFERRSRSGLRKD